MIDQYKLRQMDEEADNVIAGFSVGAFAANLLPPPADTLAVGSIFATMGAALADVYNVPVNRSTLSSVGSGIAKGVAAVAAAGYFGTSLLKWIPGLNIWIALLVQPPIVSAIAYSAGSALKDYFHIYISEGRFLTSDQVRDLAEQALRHKLGK